MELCYTIGPYRSKEGIYGIKKNIDRAEALGVALWKLGYAVIVPHKNTAFIDGAIPDDQILEGDFAMLRRCDFAVTVDGWEHSVGSRQEISLCDSLGIPVYHSLDEVIRHSPKSRFSDRDFF